MTQDLLVSGAGGWGGLGTSETYIRDAYQRVTELRRVYDAGVAPIRATTRFTYRPDGRIATKSDVRESTVYTRETYTYDARGLVSTRTIYAEGDYTYGHDELGRNELLVFPDGHERRQQYDDAGRLTSRCYRYPATSLAPRCYTVTYDAAGNRRQMSDPDGVDLIDADAVGRVSGVTRGSAPTQAYAYNSLGALAINGNVALDVKRPRLDTPSALVDSAIPNTVGGQPVTLYPGGRVTQLRGTQLQANRRGYITIVTNPDGTTARHGYDPMMRRPLYRPSVGATEYYVYGGANLEASLRLNATAPADTYLFDGVDQPLRIKRGTTLTYYELDLAGNVRRLRGSGGSDLGGYRYNAFGVNLEDTATSNINQPLRWKARPYLAIAGGIYDMRARWWAPEAGAFLQIDALGYLNPRSTMWGWPGANPLLFRDPSGHDGFLDPLTWSPETQAWL